MFKESESGPEVIQLFSCSTQLSMKFVLLINLKLLTIENYFLLNIAEHQNISANNMKMPMAFSYLLAEKFSRSALLSKKMFYNLGPGVEGDRNYKEVHLKWIHLLILVLLNKLRCHAHFQFSANQIT